VGCAWLLLVTLSLLELRNGEDNEGELAKVVTNMGVKENHVRHLYEDQKDLSPGY
jgi:hypothetical protein